MKDDFFKQMDPAGDSCDTLLNEGRSSWKVLAAKRRKTLRWRKRGLVAATCAMIGCCFVYVAKPSRDATIASLEKRTPSSMSDVQSSSPPPPAPTIVRTNRTKKQSKSIKLTLAAFEKEMNRAGQLGTTQWKQVVLDLASSPAPIQRQAVELVTKIEDHESKLRAMQLVGEAAGKDESRLLLGWLNQPKTRDAAWQRCVAVSTPNDWQSLRGLARGESEKRILCQRIWQNTEPQSADALVQLAASPQWRQAIRSSARAVPADWTLRLIKQLRQHNVNVRTATAFVLASIPGQQVDRLLAEMVRQGRYRQPCYLTLMSRDTDVAKSFLSYAARQRALAPALVSAQSHFNVMAPKLNHWKELTQGNSHEESRKVPAKNPAVFTS